MADQDVDLSRAPYEDPSAMAGGEAPPTPQEQANAFHPTIGERRADIQQQVGLAKSYQIQLTAAQRAIADQLDKASKNVESLQFGPTEEEKNLRWRAAFSGANGAVGTGQAIASGNQSLANTMAEQRQAQLQRAQLMMNYPIQAAQYRASAAQAGIKNAVDIARGMAYANTQPERAAQASLRTGMEFVNGTDSKDGIRIAPGYFDAESLKEATKLYGPGGFKIMFNQQGGQDVVPLAPYGRRPAASAVPVPAPAAGGTQPPQAPAPAPQPVVHSVVPQTPAPAAPQAQRAPVTPPAATAAAAPVQTGGAGAQEYRETYTPDAYGSYRSDLSNPDYQNIFASIADQAVPQIKRWNPNQIPNVSAHGQDTDVKDQYAANKKLTENIDKERGGLERNARMNLQQAQRMIALVNSYDDGTGHLKPGPLGASDLASMIRNQLSAFGIISPEAAADNNEFKKEARQLATSGLKSNFPGRVTNMELEQQIMSNPNLAMDPIALRRLLQYEVERDTWDLHKLSMWDLYRSHVGDPGKFLGWYDHNFDPYTNSLAHQAIQPIKDAQDRVSRMSAQQSAARLADLRRRAAAKPAGATQ